MSDEKIVERHTFVREGNFHPFGETSSGDFDLDEFAKRLRLRHLQKELLGELLKQLEIKIWFWSDQSSEYRDDRRHDPPGLEINVFWSDYHVGSADLFQLLKEPFEAMDNEIGYEEEIVVLNKLKTMIDDAIKARQQRLEEQKT